MFSTRFQHFFNQYSTININNLFVIRDTHIKWMALFLKISKSFVMSINYTQVIKHKDYS